MSGTCFHDRFPIFIFPQHAKVLSGCDTARSFKKGVYQYDNIKSMKRFEETKPPDLQCFYSRLDDKRISDGEYAYAETVWNTFGC